MSGIHGVNGDFNYTGQYVPKQQKTETDNTAEETKVNTGNPKETEKMSSGAVLDFLEDNVTGEKVERVMEEFEAFKARYSSDEDKETITYNTACVAFYNRLLACGDITDEQRAEFQEKISEHQAKIKDAMRAPDDEKYQDVYEEMLNTVPFETETIPEKRLALKYIERMLNCDDIPSNAKSYWTYQQDVLNSEIEEIEAEQEQAKKDAEAEEAAKKEQKE